MTQAKGHFYVEQNKILSHGHPKGVKMSAKEITNGIEAKVVVEKNAKIKEPLYFCFGMLGEENEQLILPVIEVQDGAEVTIIAHCSFPNAKKAVHKMTALFKVGKKAKFRYEEHHYHGDKSGASVFPGLKLEVDEGGELVSVFNLSQGTVGRIEIELEAFLQKSAKAHIETKVFGKSEKDEVFIFDKVHLLGENSKSLIKMRAAAKNGGKVMMQGENYARAAGATGHVDCQEIVVGEGSVAKAVPIVEVSNENARVTHEASVGKINQKELETLMTRGLSEEEATELIIEAMMKG